MDTRWTSLAWKVLGRRRDCQQGGHEDEHECEAWEGGAWVEKGSGARAQTTLPDAACDDTAIAMLATVVDNAAATIIQAADAAHAADLAYAASLRTTNSLILLQLTLFLLR